jgi:hypothetical protein
LGEAVPLTWVPLVVAAMVLENWFATFDIRETAREGWESIQELKAELGM